MFLALQMHVKVLLKESKLLPFSEGEAAPAVSRAILM